MRTLNEFRLLSHWECVDVFPFERWTSIFRSPRTATNKRRSIHSAQRTLHVESLETRDVPATDLTAFEQLFLELTNRARANPAAEAARYGIDLNEGLAAGTISTTAKQALAPNQQLINAMRGHLNYLANTLHNLSHTGAGGATLSQRVAAAGYPGGWLGENLALYPGTTADVVVESHRMLFVDSSIPGRGHRTNMLNANYNEIGTGIAYGTYSGSPPSYTYTYSGTDFGGRSSVRYITGVTYRDDVVSDAFYTVGEGLGNITVTATNLTTGVSYSDISGAAGGYAISVPSGTYSVSATGSALGGTVTYGNVVVGTENVKRDFLRQTSWLAVLSGDFNGDGRTDTLGRHSNGQFWVGSSTGTSFVNQYWGAWSAAVNWTDLQVGDMNGDGRDDVAGRIANTGEWWVGLSSGAGFANYRFASWSSAVTWVDAKLADLNGDGRDDLLARYRDGGQWWAGISNGTSFNTQLWATWSSAVTWVDTQVGDFNGDGRADLTSRIGLTGEWWTGLSTGSNFSTSRWANWSTYDWRDVQVGDFNGDGRDEIAGRVGSNGSWWVGISNGTSFRDFGSAGFYWGAWATAVNWVDVKVIDVDGDGRSDIAGRVESSGQWWVAKSNGTQFTNQAFGTWSTTVGWQDIVLGDFNGDGKQELAGRIRAVGEWWTALSTGNSFSTTRWGAWSA